MARRGAAAFAQDLADSSDYELAESPVPPSRLEGLDRQIEAMMDEWHVPGIAVAIVEDSRLVYSRGFGYRDHQARTSVDPETLFPIGSISKSFVVVALGMLADEGVLEWTGRLSTTWPIFD